VPSVGQAFGTEMAILTSTVAIRAATRSASHLVETTPADADAALAGVLHRARLQVLRATVLIAFLIALGDLAGSTVGGMAGGLTILLAAGWCLFWALAATFPAITARCFMSWRLTGLALAAVNVMTVTLTGGINSSVLAVCMYLGWIASVVVRAQAAIVLSFAATSSILLGYLLAGDSIADIFTGPHRYGAVANAVLPLLAGLVGVLLATVANAVFSGLAERLRGLREGATATTPALTELLARAPIQPVPTALPLAVDEPVTRVPLTAAEREVVVLLADGHAPKQIALLRDVKLSTVRSQIKTAKKKTGARTIPELVAMLSEGDI
jgi:DNA-binding CsgD family transcriptional regulator